MAEIPIKVTTVTRRIVATAYVRNPVSKSNPRGTAGIAAAGQTAAQSLLASGQHVPPSSPPSTLLPDARDRVRRAMKRAKLSQAAVAAASGLPASVVQQFLAGRLDPSARVLELILKAVGLKLSIEPA